MKIWEVLTKENIGKKFKTKIYGLEKIVEVGYDYNSDKWLTVKKVGDGGVRFPLSLLYLGAILEMEFEQI